MAAFAEAQDAPTTGLYHEPLRPQFHFSAKQGWLNDPNGLVYADGQYHLFYQATPGSRRSEEKWWGHATSPDLVHWTELPAALVPDADDSMWSGSAVVDRENRSGFGQNGQPPLVLIYTRALRGNEQRGQTSLAHGTDGVHFTKYAENPVIGDLGRTNRDPRVFWYAPDKKWMLVLYVEDNDHHNVRFFRSDDLKHWTAVSQFEGGRIGHDGQPSDNFLYECPDFWEMPVEGEPGQTRWVLTAGNSEYMVGSFDGTTFKPETPKLPGQRGRGYYAAQTFNDEPQRRRVRLGWLWTDAPGTPFTQSMSLPSEHRLVRTPEGLRLTWSPVRELETLREETYLSGDRTVAPDDANPLAKVDTDLLEIRAAFAPGKTGKVTFTVRGVPVVYDAAKSELTVQDRRIAAPPADGKMDLTLYADRLSLEVYANGGLIYVPLPVDFKPDDRGAGLKVERGKVAFERLDAYRLRSAWPTPSAK